jgi:thiamine biosynthesis lipoprotein
VSRPASTSFPALGTTALVAVERRAGLPRAARLVERQVDLLDRACSRFRADSELRSLRAGGTCRVSPLLARAVAVALAAATDTDGLVDPTLGAHLRAAGYDRTFSLVRERGGWTPRPPGPGGSWRDVVLRERELRLPPAVELDLGATAKAWLADRCAAAAARLTGAGVLVSLGGDVAVAGRPPAGGWPVLVADDHTAPLDGPGPVVAVELGGLATSSTTVRRWPTTAGDAHHLLDPRTAAPARSPWRTVSVAARSCLDANVASTAAIVVGRDAPDWLRQRGLPSRLVGVEGGVVRVCGWPAEERAA